MRVCFPDGTCVTARPLSERRSDRADRDFGLYLDPAWAPTWEADVIDWEDYGVPKDPQGAASQIIETFRRARSGDRVEVGCLGGLGRTGTVLACMAVLSGVAPSSAVRWVREHYRAEAVETVEQEAWVGWFGDEVAPASGKEASSS